jgi:hypothetical protein
MFARNAEIVEPVQRDLPCPVPLAKIFPFRTHPVSNLYPPPSCPNQRGVSRTSRTSGRDAVDADARLTGDTNADGEVVWS